MYLIKLVNEKEKKQYADDTSVLNLLNYVFQPCKTIEDTVRYNPAFQGSYAGNAFISDSESEDNIASSIYQSIAEIREEYPRKCKTLFKHRVVTIPSSELILPQDLGEAGRQIISFYAQHGYLAGYAVHTDTFYVHLHIIVFTTNCIDGSGFHIPYEWKNLNCIVGKWYYQHNQRLENNLRFREQQEKILYGNPGYGELAVFSNNQIRQNKKKHHGNGHH